MCHLDKKEKEIKKAAQSTWHLIYPYVVLLVSLIFDFLMEKFKEALMFSKHML